MKNGYDFIFADGSDLLTFPITPGELTIKSGSNNDVVSLISEGDVNILKSPSLTEVEFEARFPMRQYPYARPFAPFETYWDKFKELKEKKKPFRFIVSRTDLKGSRTWDTNLLMALEDIEIKESADEGDDVLVSFTLKQYKEYGVKTIKLPTSNSTTTSTSNENRDTDNKTESSQTYVVKSGDCLWNIAKKFYGNGAKWKIIYDANKTVIENTAKKYGRKSSSNGHWIYPGTKLVIPGINSTTSSTSTSTSPSASGNKTYAKYKVTITQQKQSKFTQCKVTYFQNGKPTTAKMDVYNSRVFSVDANSTITLVNSVGKRWTVVSHGLTINSGGSRATAKVSKSGATITVIWPGGTGVA